MAHRQGVGGRPRDRAGRTRLERSAVQRAAAAEERHRRRGGGRAARLLAARRVGGTPTQTERALAVEIRHEVSFALALAMSVAEATDFARDAARTLRHADF